MRLAIRIFMALAVCIPAVAERAEAVVSASASAPIRAGIDAGCKTGAVAAAAKAPVKGHIVWLARTGKLKPGTTMLVYGPWNAVPAAVQAAATVAEPTESATVVVANGTLTFVHDVTSEASGDGAVEHEYCYASGKLVRAKITLDDVSDDLVYSREVYYDSSGAPLADSGQQSKLLSAGAKPQQLPASSLAIPPYAKAAQQPFYTALQHALAQ